MDRADIKRMRKDDGRVTDEPKRDAPELTAYRAIELANIYEDERFANSNQEIGLYLRAYARMCSSAAHSVARRRDE